MMGLPLSQGLSACLIILDCFTKTVLFRAMPGNVGARELAHAVQDMVVRPGWCPRVLVSDRDTKFMGTVAQHMAEALGMGLYPTTPYNQQANPVERYVQTAMQSLRAMCLDKPQESWVDLLGVLELALNTTPSTVTGYAPYDLLYVHRPRLLFDLAANAGVSNIEEAKEFSRTRLNQAMESVREAQAIQSMRYNKRKDPLPTLHVGTMVMVRLNDRPLGTTAVPTKLSPRLAGPFRVKEVLSPHRVRLNLPKGLHITDEFAVGQLQVVPADDESGKPGLRDQAEGEDWEPEMIYQERMYAGRHKQYLVKWKQSDLVEWVFEEDLLDDGCEDLINAWHDDQMGLGTPPLDPRRAAMAHPVFAIESGRPLPAASGIHDDVSGDPLFRSAFEALERPIHHPRTLDIDGRSLRLVERPVAFASRPTGIKESKLKGLELEATGLLWAFNHHRHLLQGASMTVVTDHSPLGAVMTAPSHRVFTPRLKDIRAQLAPYLHQMTFVHKAGDTHINVDSLSRLPQDQ
ncbi:unnamed protein product [Parajaminaea phylloscopi]